MGEPLLLVNGTIPFGPDSNCTLDTCPLEWSILRYRPSLVANGLFIGLFAKTMIIHLFQGLRKKTWGFTALIASGCILETVGYGGRLIMYYNPFSFEGLLMQIICITIAPVFFSAAIYILLSQTINFLDPALSRFDPRVFYWTFIPSDLVSLVLQAIGGAMSCMSTSEKEVNRGVYISLAGLVFQVISLLAFCTLFADYLSTYFRSTTRPKTSNSLRLFLSFLCLSTLLILLRCVYRIVELHEGYFSHWFRDEPLFIALESAVMCLAVFCLNFGHPGLAFGGTSPAKSVSGAPSSPVSRDGTMVDSMQEATSANKTS